MTIVGPSAPVTAASWASLSPVRSFDILQKRCAGKKFGRAKIQFIGAEFRKSRELKILNNELNHFPPESRPTGGGVTIGSPVPVVVCIDGLKLGEALLIPMLERGATIVGRLMR